MANWRKGHYTVVNPDKYLGDPDNVIYRSSWELDAFRKLDLHPDIIGWASEEISIPYPKPQMDGSYSRGMYVPDLFIVKRNRNGGIDRELIEIKPDKYTKPSRARKPLLKLQEQYQYTVNQHKWAAAEEWCKQYGITFRIMTEKNMFV